MENGKCCHSLQELLESKQSYGLEYVLDGKVVGFILRTSMLFHYGRTFEINDLAVDPEFQRRGIAKELLEKCLADIKAQGMVGVHLITAGEGVLPEFYAKYGFKKETEVILMADREGFDLSIAISRCKNQLAGIVPSMPLIVTCILQLLL